METWWQKVYKADKAFSQLEVERRVMQRLKGGRWDRVKYFVKQYLQQNKQSCFVGG